MLFKSSLLVLLGAAAASARQVPIVDGVVGGVPDFDTKIVQADAAVATFATTPGKLRVVENSGVCETTPGVNQVSGYGDLTASESLW